MSRPNPDDREQVAARQYAKLFQGERRVKTRTVQAEVYRLVSKRWSWAVRRTRPTASMGSPGSFATRDRALHDLRTFANAMSTAAILLGKPRKEK
jgi:hypothetical protein